MADCNHLLLEPCSSVSTELERDTEEILRTSHVDRNNKDVSSNCEKIISDKVSKSKLFKRRNIRNILERDRLSAATLDAQRKEQERLNRVSLLSDDAQCHNSSEVQQQTAITTTSCLDEAEREELLKRYEIWKKFSSERKQLFDNDVVTLSSDEDDNISKAKKPCNNFDRKISTSDNGYDSEIICVESDDDDSHMPEASTSQQADDVGEDSQNVPDTNGKMLVNVGHPKNDPDIFIPDHLTKIIKPHQLGGIRFMYNNIIESLTGFETKSGFGCVLAHSMGLGKTLQVVTFVDILYRHTKGKRILILVPINTLQNWMAEFEHWLPANDEDIPHRSFDVFCLDEKAKTTIQRLSVVENWYKKMGVLLMGYEMFRLLANKDLSKNKKKQSIINVQNCKPNVHSILEAQALADDLRRFLINPGPDLIVCDEGHRIKTMQTHISKTLSQIKTQRRIVLTGYPLQNNMFEYWCMVNFVRPNYLGTKHEFSNMFERPIKNGQCADSTPNDARLMRYRVHVLTNLLKGFVQRWEY
uniref:Helicase ATP-binding domain-containing protein n=1 Tax=Romanomermis culicivorax TaxID=13658 RepID=A0A915L7D5_ROMCU